MSGILDALRTFKPRPVDAWMFEHPVISQQLVSQILYFPCMALPSNDKPTVLCGLVHNFCGAGEIWMVTGEGFERTAKTVLQQQRRLARDFYKALGLHRLHILVDSDRKDARRWAEALGFQFEARLKKYGPRGEDRDMFLFNSNEGG